MAHSIHCLPYLVPGTTYKLEVEFDGTVTGTPTYTLYVDGSESVAATSGSNVSGDLYLFSVSVPGGAVAGSSARIRIAATVDAASKTYDFNSIVVTVLDKGYALGDAGPSTLTQRIIVKTSTGTRIGGAEVWITSDAAGQNMIAGILSTNDQGEVDFRLTAGTYYVWRAHEDHTFSNPQSLVVA